MISRSTIVWSKLFAVSCGLTLQSQLTPAQLDEEMDFVKLRLREEIITAAYSNDAGARVLLDSDPQVLRALEALPDAKRLAESVKGQIFQANPEPDVRHTSVVVDRNTQERRLLVDRRTGSQSDTTS